MPTAELRIAIHAPTHSSLERARRYLGNVMQARHGITARIVINGDGVDAALDAPDALADQHTLVCPTTSAAAVPRLRPSRATAPGFRRP